MNNNSIPSRNFIYCDAQGNRRGIRVLINRIPHATLERVIEIYGPSGAVDLSHGWGVRCGNVAEKPSMSYKIGDVACVGNLVTAIDRLYDGYCYARDMAWGGRAEWELCAYVMRSNMITAIGRGAWNALRAGLDWFNANGCFSWQRNTITDTLRVCRGAWHDRALKDQQAWVTANSHVPGLVEAASSWAGYLDARLSIEYPGYYLDDCHFAVISGHCLRTGNSRVLFELTKGEQYDSSAKPEACRLLAPPVRKDADLVSLTGSAGMFGSLREWKSRGEDCFPVEAVYVPLWLGRYRLFMIADDRVPPAQPLRCGVDQSYSGQVALIEDLAHTLVSQGEMKIG